MRELLGIAVLMWASLSWGALTVVQHNGTGSAANSTDVTLALSSTTSNLLVVATSRNGSSDSVASVTDNVGNIYTQATNARGTIGSVTSDIWYCAKAVAGVTAVTVHWGIVAANGKFLEVWEVNGFTVAIQDGGNTNSNLASANVITGASITTTSNNGFIAALAHNSNSSIDQNPNSGNEFTSGGDILSTGSSNVGALSLLSSTAAAHNAAWHTTTATPNETNSIAGFKEGALKKLLF